MFSKSKKYPVLVEWWETKAKVACKDPLSRTDKFRPDPLLPKETDLDEDYKNSGYDRGHMMPAKSNQCQTQEIQNECFYFSNMAAQYHSLNAGDWKSLESYTRELALKYDSIKVWCGSIGEERKIGIVTVPKQCWKVVYIKRMNTYTAYLFDNNSTKADGVKNNEVPVELIERITGFKFRNK